MCLREHVLDFQAGADVPFGNVCLVHLFLPLIRNAHVNQIHHDIVTTSDNFRHRHRLVLNQFFGVSEPNVSPVRQTGNLEQFGKRLWLRFFKHSANEPRSEFRNAERSRFRLNLFFRDAQNLRSGKQRHHTGVISRDRLWFNSRKILQHANHRRIIVTKTVELQNIVVNRVEIEVSRAPGRIDVVCRILNRREIINIHVVGNNQNSGRVLSGRAFDARCSLGQAIDFGRPQRPICNSSYCSGTKSILFSKNITNVQVG